MIRVILGVKGSGNTKELMNCISEAVAAENGSLVCIEKGSDLTYDVDYRVRLINASDYGMEGISFLQGFLAGLHGGNYDINEIFIDNLFKIVGGMPNQDADNSFNWLDNFSAKNGVKFTVSVSGDPEMATDVMQKFL